MGASFVAAGGVDSNQRYAACDPNLSGGSRPVADIEESRFRKGHVSAHTALALFVCDPDFAVWPVERRASALDLAVAALGLDAAA